VGPVNEEAGKTLRRMADVFTAHNCKGPLTCQEEAFGVSIAEAMASGLPVVTGSSGAIPEYITNSITGILVAPGDIVAHGEAFLQLERNPELRRTIGAAAGRKVLETFNAGKQMAELRQVLSSNPVAPGTASNYL
jgi:colanic acid/amylovoran biosynthesis glycosyltransferase